MGWHEELCGYPCRQSTEPGTLYTHALVKHELAREPEAGTLSAVASYPDGTSEVLVDQARGFDPYGRASGRLLVLNWSGAPWTSHGDGTASVAVRYRAADPPPSPLPAYLSDGVPDEGDLPELPCLVVAGGALYLYEEGE